MVNPQIASAIEQLDYHVTVGEVAARAGMNIEVVQSGMLALASDVGANLQVTESGDVMYLFPRHYRAILRSKYVRLRLQTIWQKIWNVLFYLLRISFGIILVVSIMLIFAAIATIVISTSSNQDNSRRSRHSGINLGTFFWMDDLSWLFRPGRRHNRQPAHAKQMNFFEAVFSVLFGDGDPNATLEAQRWQSIGAMIRQNHGAIAAEQAMPYLDLPAVVTDEDFMIPILSRFNGHPKVTKQGELIYHFPELQTTAVERQQTQVTSALTESLWTFSRASLVQTTWTIGLGILNLTGALVLQSMLQSQAIALGGFVGFVGSILWVLLIYGIGFLAIPALRFCWIRYQNKQIHARNQQRMQKARCLQSPDSSLALKLRAAQTYQKEVVLSEKTLAYTTEKNMMDQMFDKLIDP